MGKQCNQYKKCIDRVCIKVIDRGIRMVQTDYESNLRLQFQSLLKFYNAVCSAAKYESSLRLSLEIINIPFELPLLGS